MSLSVFRRNPYALGLSIAALAVLAACGGSDGPTTPVATPEPAEQYVPPEPPSGYTPKPSAMPTRTWWRRPTLWR